MSLGPWPEDEMGMIWVDGVALVWDGAHCLNLQVLWPGTAPIEVDNHAHPGVHGLLPRAVMQTELTVELHYLLSTTTLADGTATSNPAAGAFSHWRRLVTRAGTPASWSSPTGAVLRVEDPAGGLWQGRAQLEVSQLGRDRGSAVPAVVSVTIPRGVLLAVTP